MKYRYIMSGSFEPQNKSFLQDFPLLTIDIPCPHLRRSYKEAMKDNHFVYRFGYREGQVGILVIQHKTQCVIAKKRTKYIEIPPICITFYDYVRFKQLGGIIYNIPKEVFCTIDPSISEENFEKFKQWAESEKPDWEPKDYEVLATFNDLFPSLHEGSSPVYIDDEAYRVEEVK